MDNSIHIEVSVQHYYEKVIVSTIASMIAALIVIFAFYPLECIEGKMQIGQLEKTGVLTAL